MENIKLRKSYERTIEMLEELGKIDIDIIENIQRTINDLAKLGHETCIDEGYLIIK